MTTKTFCRYCRAFSTADEAAFEHLMSCAGCKTSYPRCDLYAGLAKLRDVAENEMVLKCPGGDCGEKVTA